MTARQRIAELARMLGILAFGALLAVLVVLSSDGAPDPPERATTVEIGRTR